MTISESALNKLSKINSMCRLLSMCSKLVQSQVLLCTPGLRFEIRRLH